VVTFSIIIVVSFSVIIYTFTIFAPMTNNHKIVDYDAVLDAKFGKEGTPERARAEEAAYSFYSGQILQDARKEAKDMMAWIGYEGFPLTIVVDKKGIVRHAVHGTNETKREELLAKIKEAEAE